MSGQRNESRNQVDTATHQRYLSRLAWVFLEDLLKTDDIPCSLSDIENIKPKLLAMIPKTSFSYSLKHIFFSKNRIISRYVHQVQGGLHQGAGGINLQVYVENRRIRNHILQQGSESENNTARTSTNILSEGDD
ncbi:hypothetical protein OS493_031402 [Desmophyllum pertusum]|uniref:Uncharacterized protein n=1 Tax=Desmophyllum pertusum TaxID=174260 RepID=A0A9W9Y8L7_9CNID|nr:hypothetical protein OS493_031402 [Desmophyllum pertusum]